MEGGSTIENFDGADGFFRQLNCRGAKGLNHEGHEGTRRETNKEDHNLKIILHAFAFAADQDSGHCVGGLASLGESRVGTVPAGVVDIVSGGTAFAVATLAAGSAVKDDFARASGPVFVNEEIGSFGGGAGGLGNQSCLGGDFLQARASVAAHG
jgi:hypothetical protein